MLMHDAAARSKPKKWVKLMKKMIKTKDGSYVVRSEIVSVTENLKKRGESKIIATDGKTYIVKEIDNNIADACELFEEAITAHPGYFMLVTQYRKKCTEVHYRKVPIVGWVKYKTLEEQQLGQKTDPFWAMPVLGGYYNFNGGNYFDWGLLLMDGRVIDMFVFEFPNVEEFLKRKSDELKKPCILI